MFTTRQFDVKTYLQHELLWDCVENIAELIQGTIERRKIK